MKNLAAFAALGIGALGWGFAASPAEAQGLPGITEIEHIGGNVYKIFGAGGNTVVFLRENDVVLVDTKLPGSGEAILAEVRRITDKPVGLVINTHAHPDHVGSNAFFVERGVKVIAHENAARRMEQGGGPFPPNKVDTTFSDFLAIGEGKDRVELHHFGPGHTDGDAFIVFPQDRIMMAGDMYAWHMSPLIDPNSGGSMLALATTITATVHGLKNVDHVIQGHGAVSTFAEFESFMTFNRGLVQTAEQTLTAGGTPEQALERLEATPSFRVFLDHKLKPGLEYGGTPWSRALVNLTVAFQELRGEKPQLIMGMPDPLMEQ